MEQYSNAPFWFKHFKKGRMLKLKTKLSQMDSEEIKGYFEKSLNDSLLYGISKEYERVLAIYILSDDSLKEELDNISVKLQNKKIDINETIMDAFAMAHPYSGIIAQDKKEALEEYHEKKAQRNNENKIIDS